MKTSEIVHKHNEITFHRIVQRIHFRNSNIVLILKINTMTSPEEFPSKWPLILCTKI